MLFSGSNLQAQEMDSLNTDTSFAELSMILLQNVRDGKPTKQIESKLAEVSQEELNADLNTEPEKKLLVEYLQCIRADLVAG